MEPNFVAELKELLGPLVDGRVYSPQLPVNPKGRTMRERVGCEFPAVAVREMQGPAAGRLQIRCYQGNGAKAKALAREALALVGAAGGYELVGKYDLKTPVPPPDPDGQVCHVDLQFRPIDPELTVADGVVETDTPEEEIEPAEAV